MKKINIILSLLVMAVAGLTSCSEDYELPPVFNPEEPDASYGTGAADNPYTISQLLGGTQANESWFTGYIVGWIDTQGGTNNKFSEETATFTAPATLASNILLAASPDEKDWTKCVPVQLSAGTVRTALNLQDNPGNLGKQVTVKANVEKYFGQDAALKNLTAYVWGDKGDGSDEPSTGGTGNGSADMPYSVAQMLGGQTGSDVWISGYIVGFINPNPDGASTLNEQWAAFTAEGAQASNIMLADSPDEKDCTKCTAIALPSGSDVRAAINLKDNPDNLGKQVSLKGNITKYFGVNGLKETSAYAWGPKGDDGGSVTPPSGDSIFEASFANNSDGGFTFDHGTLPSGLSYVWKTTATYGITASAFVSNTNYASDAWAISPVIDLTGCTGIAMTFSQAGNFFGDTATMQSMVKVCAREEGGEWTELSFSTWPTGSAWTFVSTDAISLEAYAGKKIQIGFHYTSTSSMAGTWEIKDLKITGSK